MIKMNETYNSNFLLQSAMPLLVLMTTLRKVEAVNDLDLLHQKIVDQLNIFEYKLEVQKYSHLQISSARYCIAAALDEAILTTNWGNDLWRHKTLISHVFNGANSGNKFYEILEKMLKDPSESMHFLELVYLILNLGFLGKFYNDKLKIEQILDNLAASIIPYGFSYSKLHMIQKTIIRNKRTLNKIFMNILIATSIIFFTTIIFFERNILKENDIIAYKINLNN